MIGNQFGPVAVALLLGLGTAAPVSAQAPAQAPIANAVPEAHTKAFMTECGKNEKAAACQCLARELVKTREGQIMIDRIGLSKVTPEAGADENEALARRYGMTAADMGAAAARIETAVRPVYESCIKK